MGVLGDFQKTIKCHEKVLSIDPEFIEAIFDLDGGELSIKWYLCNI